MSSNPGGALSPLPTPEREPVDAAMLGEAMSELALSARFTHPDDLPVTIARCAGYLGATNVVVYIVDLGQELLVPLHGRGEPERGSIEIDTTLAGRAFRTERIVAAPVLASGEVPLWIPLQDSAERIGVLFMTFPAVDAYVERAAHAFASLAGEYVVTKSRYGDALERTRRRQPLSLPAEMRWALMPPLTYHSPSLTISGLVQPAYTIAGDTFDYAVIDSRAHIAVFDAVGHGLEASRVANLATSSYRNSRRAGAGLHETYRALDAVVDSEFGLGMFVTGVLAELDLDRGVLRWVNAGHPLPLLVRDHRVVHELEAAPSLPAGLGGEVRAIGEQQLQPGDTVVFFTDGVVEARSPTGEQFGDTHLVDHITRAAAAHESPAETLRRLMAGILEHQQGELQDDATVVLLTWHEPMPSVPERTTDGPASL